MKILMLGWELPPHNSGGLGVACYQLCKELADKGADIKFVLPYTAPYSIDFMDVTPALPQDVVSVQKSGTAYDSYSYTMSDGSINHLDVHGQTVLYEQSIDQVIDDTEFNVIHAHDWLTCRAALRAKELTGKPLIVHIHSIESDRSGTHFGGNPLVREIERTALLIADQVVAVSEHTKASIIREYSIPAGKIKVVHNSYDAASLIEEQAESEYAYLESLQNEGYKIVASIGRLTIQKGLTNLLYAFAKVVELQPKSILLIVGSGDQYHELIGLSAQLGIAKNVLFTSFQRGKRYRDAFAVADLFVMPSVSEPFGLTPLESIGYGTPALISKQSGVAEVIHNCLKVNFWDVDEMANLIVSALRSDSLLTELHNNALQEYKKLSWSDSADKMFKLYRNRMAVTA